MASPLSDGAEPRQPVKVLACPVLCHLQTGSSDTTRVGRLAWAVQNLAFQEQLNRAIAEARPKSFDFDLVESAAARKGVEYHSIGHWPAVGRPVPRGLA